ncbi:MAG: DUF1883 domain-containing protein [Spirochaetales bacterium]|nr:DUF1883 domain-containing protein [Spirochaetales bacterium]
MNFVHYNLGFLQQGRIVRIDIDRQANVLLLDALNFNHYRNRQRYRYHGGHARSSPIDLRVPASANWHVAIDTGGRTGQIRSAVSILE